MKKIEVEWVNTFKGTVRKTTVHIPDDTVMENFQFAPLVAVEARVMLPFVFVLGHREVQQ